MWAPDAMSRPNSSVSAVRTSAPMPTVSEWSTMRFTAAIDARGMAATRAVNASTRSSSSSAGTSSSSQPTASASSASRSRPVRMSSSARARPAIHGQRVVPPAPGRMPMGTSG